MTDCRHLCCDTRTDPHHDHFLDASDCPSCMALIGDAEPVADPAEELARLRAIVDLAVAEHEAQATFLESHGHTGRYGFEDAKRARVAAVKAEADRRRDAPQ